MTDILKGATSNSLFFELVDSTTGLPKTGILFSDVTGSYCRTRSARVAITMVTLASASAAFSAGGFILEDDTNQPGVYRFDVPDAAFATGAFEVVITVKATGCRTQSRRISLVDVNNQDAVRMGLTALPNVASGSAGAIPTTGTGANQISVSSGQVILQTGTGTGQLDFTSGVVKANAVQLLGTAWLTPGTAGTPDVNAKLWNGLATVALPLTPTVAGRTLDVSAGGEAGLDWANVGSPTATVGLSGTTIGTLTTYTGNTPQTGDSYIIVNGTSGPVATKTAVDAIKAKTDNLPAAPASTTNITAGTITTVTNLTNVGVKKNTALAKFPFLMTDSTTHAPSAGKTVTVTRSIDGGAFGAGTLSAATSVASGAYTVDFAAADLNGNCIILKCSEATCDDTFVTILTNP